MRIIDARPFRLLQVFIYEVIHIQSLGIGALVLQSWPIVRGAAVQAIVRNLLASPFTFGLSFAASLGVAVALLILHGGVLQRYQIYVYNPFVVSMCAFAFSLIQVLVVLLLAYKTRLSAGLSDLAERALEELSGGELQRALIARALAGEPEVVLFDEPTSNLDLKYQLEVLSLVRSLSRRGLIVIMALHDLTQAYRASDKILLLNSGKVVAAGIPEEVLRPELLSKVYGVPVMVIKEHKVVVPLF